MRVICEKIRQWTPSLICVYCTRKVKRWLCQRKLPVLCGTEAERDKVERGGRKQGAEDTDPTRLGLEKRNVAIEGGEDAYGDDTFTIG